MARASKSSNAATAIAHGSPKSSSDLQKLYSKAVPQKVEQDILEYLERLQDQRALDFE